MIIDRPAHLTESPKPPPGSEGPCHELLAVLPAAIYTCDLNGVITYFNEQAALMWGRSPRLGDADDRFSGAYRLYRIDGSPLPHDHSPMAAALRNGSYARNQEIIIERPDGSRVWVSANTDPLRDGAGRVKGAITLLTDITERKQAEEALRQSNERFRLAAQAAGVGTYSRNFQTGEDFWSPEFLAIHGAGPNDQLVFREGIPAAVHPVDHPRVVAEVRACLDRSHKPEFSCKHRIILPDGETRWVVLRGRVEFDQQGRPLLKHGIVMDITEREREQQALRESESLYRAIARNFPDGAIYVFDRDLRFRLADGCALSTLGYRREELEGKTIWEATDAETCKILEQRYPRVLAGESFHFETSLKGRVFSSDYVPIRNDQGQVIAGMVVSHDISAVKNAEQSLRHAAQRYEQQVRLFDAIASTTPDFVYLFDLHGRFRYANRRLLEVWGMQLHDVIGKTCRELGYEQWHHDMHMREITQVIETKRSIKGEVPFKAPLTGVFGVYEYIFSPVIAPDGEVELIAGTTRDVTERNKAEETLRQWNESLEQRVLERTELAEARSRQLQTLAVELIEAEERERRRIAGLLHDDLQQILAAARFQLQAAYAKLPPELANVEHLLEESIAKSRRLSHELSPAVLYHGGLIAALKWLAEQMREQFGLQVHLDTAAGQPFESMPLKVFMFRAVQELLFNVVKHAGVKSARVALCGAEESVLITVSDQGRGFDADILEPSTSRIGLGLLSIRERASYIGGRFQIESTPGQGTRFILTVPICLSTADAPFPPDSPAETPSCTPAAETRTVQGQGVRVLFADDHKVMRQGLIRLISGQPDIQVVGEAANGREALELARQLRPDLIVMDISMPGMDGIEATRHIKAELPQVRVIGLSMFEDEQAALSMREAGAEAFVSKAASAADLLQAIYGGTRDKKQTRTKCR
jgi:PAS domain S-box-containing protein